MPSYTIECDCCRAWLLTACDDGRTMKVFNQNLSDGDVIHIFGECWTVSGPTADLTGAQNLPGNPATVDGCEDLKCDDENPPDPDPGDPTPPIYIWKLERYNANSCLLDGLVIYTATDLSQANNILRLTEYGEHCWKKSIVIKANQELVDVTVAESFPGCEQCVTSVYKLVDCNGIEDDLYVNGESNFSAVTANGWGEILGKVVEYNGDCWTVTSCSGGECDGKSITPITLTAVHDSCPECFGCTSACKADDCCFSSGSYAIATMNRSDLGDAPGNGAELPRSGCPAGEVQFTRAGYVPTDTGWMRVSVSSSGVQVSARYSSATSNITHTWANGASCCSGEWEEESGGVTYTITYQFYSNGCCCGGSCSSVSDCQEGETDCTDGSCDTAP